MAFSYLENNDFDIVLQSYIDFIRDKIEYRNEEIEVSEGLNRVTTQAVYAKISSPYYASSAMDGIAVLASKTFGATETTPIILKENIDFVRIDTGDPLPGKFDTVIMIEDVIDEGNGVIKLINASYPYQNVRQIGEDICQGEMIIPSNTLIEPATIGALLAGGISKIKVWKKITIGIIPTGDEIIKTTEIIEKGKIFEFNSKVFSSMITNWNENSKIYDIVPDKYDLIKKSLLNALNDCDIVLINAGSSAGREDYTYSVIKECGEVLFHGISIKPGKPTILGFVKNKVVIGVPGYPVSGIIVMEKILKKVVELYKHNNFAQPLEVDAKISRKIVSSLKYKEYIRIKLGDINGNLIATPLSSGAGVISSIVKADGILTIPQNSEGLESSAQVKIELLKNFSNIKNTIVITGSHDPLIDEITDLVRIKCPDYFASSSHVGSMGGIMAIKKNEAHIAGIHLLDESSGEYNKAYIKKYLNADEIELVKGVKRIQGLMVSKGNPKKIKNINDIAGEKIKYVNRQKGSGTRILFDYLLKKNNLDHSKIYGYLREEITHLSVAVQIASKNADCGMGIYSAAKIYDLDFIPLCEEEYDFITPRVLLDSDLIKIFLTVFGSQDFKKRLIKMGGYKI